MNIYMHTYICDIHTYTPTFAQPQERTGASNKKYRNTYMYTYIHACICAAQERSGASNKEYRGEGTRSCREGTRSCRECSVAEGVAGFQGNVCMYACMSLLKRNDARGWHVFFFAEKVA